MIGNEKFNLSVFIDESGSITKTNVSHNKYFIIAILFTHDSVKLKTNFRRGISRLIKKKKFKDILDANGEIKGSDISEIKKRIIYDKIFKNCKDDFEIGIIVLDNSYTTEQFIKNHARTFNYILQLFFDNSFRHASKYVNYVNNMYIILDEQNIATDAKYTLDGYLEQHFTVLNPLCNHFDVKYADSKNHSLLQFIDFVSNTFYRNIEKHNKDSIENVKKFLPYLCGGKIFDFSTNHDTKLLLEIDDVKKDGITKKTNVEQTIPTEDSDSKSNNLEEKCLPEENSEE